MLSQEFPDATGRDFSGSSFAKSSFVLLLVLPAFISAEAVSVLYVMVFVYLLLLSGLKVRRGVVSLVVPLLCLLGLGLLQAYRHPVSDVVKDVWYLLKVFFALGAGYCYVRYIRSYTLLLRLVVLAAVILAVVHLLKAAWAFQGGISLMALRDEVGGGYFLTVVGLGILVGISRARVVFGIDRWGYWVATFVCSGSLIASGSRTSIVSFLLMLFILRGWARIKPRTLVLLASLVVGGVFIGGTLDTNQDERGLFAKFARSATEVAVVDYDDMRDINLYWRGFESHRAYLAFLDAGLVGQLIGQGFGAMVDLGFYMPLAGAERRYIPHLHNGYMYVLVKYGLLGVLVYLFFIVRLISIGFNARLVREIDVAMNRRLIASLGWVFLVSSLVITGLFNKSVFDSVLVVLGASMAFYSRPAGGTKGYSHVRVVDGRSPASRSVGE